MRRRSELATVLTELLKAQADGRPPETAGEKFDREVRDLMEVKESRGRRMLYSEAAVEVARRDPDLYRRMQREEMRGTREHAAKVRLLSERGKTRTSEEKMLSERFPVHGKKPWRHVTVIDGNGTRVTSPRRWTQLLFFWKSGASTEGHVFTYAGAPIASPSDVDWTGGGRDEFVQQVWRCGIQLPDPGVPDRGGARKMMGGESAASAETLFLAEVGRRQREAAAAGESMTFTEAAAAVARDDKVLYASYRAEQDEVSKARSRGGLR